MEEGLVPGGLFMALKSVDFREHRYYHTWHDNSSG